MSETADRVKKIVVEHLGVEADKVTEDTSFIDDLGADSLDIVELVMAFEEEFGVEIRSEEHTSELQSLMRISYAVFCLKKKKNKIPHRKNNKQRKCNIYT